MKQNYKFLINKRKGLSLKHWKDFKAFIEYSNDMGDIYENFSENDHQDRECKTLIVFMDMIDDVLNKKSFKK